MRAPHRSLPTAVGSIAAEFIASLPQASKVQPTSAEASIRAVLGKPNAYCTGVRLADGRLLVTTSGPAVAHHLRSHAPDLLSRLQPPPQ